MTDTSLKILIWSIITLIACVIAFICYRWLSNVSRFENRKKEISIGMLTCILAISSLMFLPVLFSRIDLHQSGIELSEQIQFTELETAETGSKLSLPPFIKPFANVLALLPHNWIFLLVYVVPSIASLLIVFFIAQIILKIREPKKKDGEEDNRKHLFEYNSEILTKLNKDSQR